MPENESGSTAHDQDCSLNSCESFAWFDRDSWSWKTSQRCLVEGWATYSESFPRAGTMRNGIAYRRQASAPLTGGTGCLSWPTPTAIDSTGRGQRAPGSTGNHLSISLEYAVNRAMWPTPNKEDSRGGVSQTPGGARASGLNANVGGSLNPQWVEWLMGFPPEWTALSASETPSSRKSRKSSGGESGI